MTYAPEHKQRLLEAVLAGIEGGLSLRESCRQNDISPVTILRWCDETEDISEQYARARDALIDFKIQELLSIADDGSNDTYQKDNGDEAVNVDVIARSKLRYEAHKWVLSRLMRRRLGDKVQTEITGANGGPVRYARELSDAELLAIASAGKDESK